MDYSRHLLIDAYNVIHQWPELRRALREGVTSAREALASRVQVLHDHERLRVTLVFDGQGSEIEIERPGRLQTFSYVYSAKTLSADDVIERMIGAAADPEMYLVVTNDLAERHTVEALGAHALSPDDLQSWVTAAERAVTAKLRTRQKQVEADWHRKIEFGE